jgi:hypothetical protein
VCSGQCECNATGPLGAGGSSHCVLGFEPWLCPACNGHGAPLHRQAADLPAALADSPSPPSGHSEPLQTDCFFGVVDEPFHYFCVSPFVKALGFCRRHVSGWVWSHAMCRGWKIERRCLMCRYTLPHLARSIPGTMNTTERSLDPSILDPFTCKVT